MPIRAPNSSAVLKRVLRSLKWAIIIASLIATVDYWTFPLFASKPRAFFDQRSNGLWLRYPWYFGQHSDFEVADLGSKLDREGIRYAYFHVRDAKPDGSLRYSKLLEARHLNRLLAKSNPSLKRIAWFYVGNKAGRGAVDLSRQAVRSTLIESARSLVEEGDFQGIQWDYEICPNGDPNFISLLQESRQSLPSGTWIGAATPTTFPWPVSGFGWRAEYFAKVADSCDQIAVMAYDMGMYHPRLYSRACANQVNDVGDAIAKSKCKLIIGIPTYEDGTLSHNPRAENLANAIRSIRGALEDTHCSSFEGVAIFADYTTDETEWRTYRSQWCGR